MNKTLAVFKRELAGYFATPVAYVFITIFLVLSGALTFMMGNLLGRGQADLQPFFNFHPWLYLVLIPAISMRLWAEERKSGTIEMLLTLPLTQCQAVVGKFLAAWAFTGIALALTFPVWITVNVLGGPDNGVIFAGYIGSLLMAGGYLAIGSALSAITRNQVIAFVLTAAVAFVLTVAGTPMVLDFFSGWAPAALTSTVASLSIMTHFQAIQTGVLDLRDLIYFVTLIALFLYANALILDLRKAD